MFGIDLPWKAIGIGLAALAVIGVIWAGYSYVDNLSNELAATKAKLAAETILKQNAEARSTEILRQHDDTVRRVQELETQRAEIERENATLQSEIQNMTTEKDFEENPVKAADDFNTQSHRVNRLLESVSRGERPVDRRPAAGR